MNIIQIVGIGIIATVLIVTIRDEKPEFSLLLSLATGVLIFMFVVERLGYVITVLKDLSRRADFDFIYFATILKIIGVAYICQFGSEIAKDAGEGAIASKIELAGKIMIIIISVPILLALLELIVKIMP